MYHCRHLTSSHVLSFHFTNFSQLFLSALHATLVFFFFSSRRRHTRYWRDWSSDVCSSDLRRFSAGWMGSSKPSPPRSACSPTLSIRLSALQPSLSTTPPRPPRSPRRRRSEERRVGKEGRSRWSPYH